MIKLPDIWSILSKLRSFIFFAKDQTRFLDNVQSKYHIGIAIDIACVIIVLFYGFGGNTKPIVSPLASSKLASFLFQTNENIPARETTMITLSSGETVSLPNLLGLFSKNMKYKNYIISSAKEFMSLPPSSQLKTKKELQMLRYLTKNKAAASDMIFASQAVTTKPGRAWTMEYLWQLRQQGELSEFNIYPFPQKSIDWAVERNIDPRMLAIATDLYDPVIALMQAKPELFFEAAEEKAKDANIKRYVPSPAVIAMLQMTETGWHFNAIQNELQEIGEAWQFSQSLEDRAAVNIGSVSAWDALNLSPDWFPSGQIDLVWIANRLEETSGLPYKKNVFVLPGSIRGSSDGSGGAIGPQLMPINARLFMEWYTQANEKLKNKFPSPNPFNPWTGTMLTYLYLSSEFYHRQANVENKTEVIRPGYSILEGTDAEHIAYDRYRDPRIRALLKWNPLYWQAKAAVQAGDEYHSIWKVQITMSRNIKG